MAQYRKCPYCSANLDPGEMCDCEETMRERGWVKQADGSYAPSRKENVIHHTDIDGRKKTAARTAVG